MSDSEVVDNNNQSSFEDKNQVEDIVVKASLPEEKVKFLPIMDNMLVAAMLLMGIDLMWSSLANYSIMYWPIGINREIMFVSASAIAFLSLGLSLLSMRNSEIRFSMSVFMLSLMMFINCFTPLITGAITPEAIILIVVIVFCMLSMLFKREWIPFLSLFVFVVAEILMWAEVIDYRITMVWGFCISGFIMTYYACGVFLYRDLGWDTLHVTTSYPHDDIVADSTDIFEIMNSSVLSMLLFISGVYYYSGPINSVTCVPILVLSAIVILISFFGMERGFIPEGTFSLIIGVFFLGESIAMFAAGVDTYALLTSITFLPLFVVLVIFWRRRDYLRIISCAVIIVYFVAICMVPQIPHLSVMLTVMSFLFLYSGISRLVYKEFNVELPLYKYV